MERIFVHLRRRFSLSFSEILSGIAFTDFHLLFDQNCYLNDFCWYWLRHHSCYLEVLFQLIYYNPGVQRLIGCAFISCCPLVLLTNCAKPRPGICNQWKAKRQIFTVFLQWATSYPWTYMNITHIPSFYIKISHSTQVKQTNIRSTHFNMNVRAAWNLANNRILFGIRGLATPGLSSDHVWTEMILACVQLDCFTWTQFSWVEFEIVFEFNSTNLRSSKQVESVHKLRWYMLHCINLVLFNFSKTTNILLLGEDAMTIYYLAQATFCLSLIRVDTRRTLNVNDNTFLP